MLLKDLILLDMLRKRLLKEKFTFKDQKIIRANNRFSELMTLLDNNNYINKITTKQPYCYTLTDKGFLYACLLTSDKETPEKFSNMVSGFIHFTIEK